MIVIIVASDPEIRFLEKQISIEERNFHSGVLFLEGFLAGKKVLVVKSGIGPKKARHAAKQVLKRGVPDGVVSIGAAGAVDPLLKAGSCIVLKEIIRLSKNPVEKDKVFSCDEYLSKKVFECLNQAPFKVVEGIGLTTNLFIHTRSEKNRLFEKYTAQGVDMESAALAEVFSPENIPFADLRIITDPAYCDTVDVNRIYLNKRKGVMFVLFYFLKNPCELLRAWRLKTEMKRAGYSIARAAEIIVSCLP